MYRLPPEYAPDPHMAACHSILAYTETLYIYDC